MTAQELIARLEAAEARATVAQDRIAELEAERERLAHEKHIALEALEMAEADVERLRVEVEAARECKERRCPYGLWRKAIADTQGQGEKEPT